jgi:hypothetical protein
MQTNKTIGIAIAALALAGCGTMGSSGGGGTPGNTGNPPTMATTRADCPDAFSTVATDRCQQSLCAIPVQVVWDGKACQVLVGSQVLQMQRGNRGATIQWWLPRESPWEFRGEATRFALPVNFKDQSAPALRDQFSNLRVGPDNRVSLRNENSNSLKYEYQIRVYKKGGGPRDYIDSVDPVIYNDF